MIRSISTVLISLFLLTNIQAQNFDAKIELGFNASQIDGDQFAGYSKVGLHTGLAIEYDLSDKWRLGSGIFYDALGSQRQIQIGSSNPAEQQKTQLTYVSVPLMMVYRMPASEENGLSISGGFQVGYLINSQRPDFIDDPILQYFSEVDIAGALGIDYRFSANSSIGFKASESFTFLFNNNKVSEINANSLRNRYLTFSFKRHL